MKEFLKRAAAFIMLAVYSLSVAPAKEFALTYQAERRTLDAYLERAQIQTDKEKFEKIAEQGIGAAVAEWEQSSLELKFSDYDEWLLQKDALQEELQNQKDLSFASWAQKRQDEQRTQIQKTALYDELKTAALEFAYIKADGSATRIVDKEFIDEAKSQWSQIADEILERYLEGFADDDFSFAQSEFLAMENAITNSLVNELLYDHASLKKMSDAEAASVIAQQLADDAEKETGESMAALFNAMQTELDGIDQNAASADGEKEWLEKFQKELQAGLAKWDEAERSFLASRVEWEQNAENVFLNDNQKWMEAYNELEARKTQWAEKIEKQIQDGKAQWQAKLSNLENEVDEYFEDFQYKLALELQQKEQLVDAGISAYNQSREILVMAQNGISNWYARWGEKYKGLYSYWKTEDPHSFGESINLNSTTTQNLKNEINKWKATYKEIEESADEKILSQYDFDKNVWNASEELFEWLDLYDTYSAQAKNYLTNLYEVTGSAVENSDYNELENEQAKLEALETYWQSREKTALAVYEYAQNTSSGLEAAAETEENLKKALDNYQAKKAEYQKKMQNLLNLQENVSLAQENYFAVAAAAQEALENLEAERALYDGLYAQWSAANEQKSFKTFLALKDELDAIELNDTDFEQLLVQYHSTLLQEEQKEFDQKIVILKGILAASRQDEESNVHLDLENLESLGIDSSQVQASLSAEQHSAIMLLIDGSAEEIEEFFSENHEFKEIYDEYQDYSRALLDKKQAASKAALQKTMAEHSSKNVEEYCQALNDAAKDLGKADKGVLELYTKALLDQSKDSRVESELAEKINSLFANARLIIEQKNYHAQVFESFFQSAPNENATQENANAEQSETDFALLDTVEERAQILERIQQAHKNVLELQKIIEELNGALSAKQNDISNAQREYEAKTDALRGDFPGSALNKYLANCDSYNNALKESQELYAQMENARREYRIAEEIYFYAQNEYLHGTTDVESPLQLASQKLLETQTALQALFEVKAEKAAGQNPFADCKELNDYKESAKQYYKARVLAYEYERETSGQRESLYQAQLAEQAALSRLVCEYKDNMRGTEFAIPAIASDFISAVKTQNADGTYSYSFILNKVEEIEERSPEERQNSDEILAEYYTNECKSIQDVYGNKSAMTLAKSDALEFLKNLETKNYSIEDLALAVLYLKMQGTAEQKARWLKSDEDPTVNANYPVGDLPEKSHSVEIWDAYEEGRQDALLNAYNKVIANGGNQDIANYILFSETNISSSLELYKRQHDTLSARAYENVINRLDSRIDSMVLEIVTITTAISALAAIACIPCIGKLAAAVPLAAALASLAVAELTKSKVEEIKYDAICLKNGYEQCAQTLQKTQETYFNTWKAANAERQAQEERFNLLNYGTTEPSGKKITWKNFKSALDELCQSGKSSATVEYFKDMHNSESKNLKQLFYKTTKEEYCTSISQVIEKMYSSLIGEYQKSFGALNDYAANEMQKKDAAADEFYSLLQNGESENYKENLKAAASAAWGKDSFDIKQFNLELLSLMGKEILPTLPVRAGESTENYVEEIFGDIKEIYLSQLSHNALAQEEIKTEYFSLLQNDLQEQYSSWLEKISAAVNIGISEWEKSDEKLNAAYNSWQKEWLTEYAEKNAEWDASYKEFLQDKQAWINQSYSQTGAAEFKIKNYAASSKMQTATKMDGEISEYVSSLYDAQKFARLADFTDTLLSFADNGGTDISNITLGKIDFSILQDFDKVVAMQDALESEMKKSAAKYQAQELQIQFEQELKNYFASIEEQNKNMEDWELDLVRKAGYTVDSEIHRNAIVDSTAFKTIREKQTVHRYQFFTAQAPQISFDASAYQGNNDFFIMKKIEDVQAKIRDWQEDIFGKTDSSGRAKTKGRLQEHIGESARFVGVPDLSKSKQENLEYAGSGQMGLIMADYLWNSFKNSAGYAEFSKAVYDQKLTDKEFGPIKLPTIREISNIICDIVGNSGQAWVKYLDDAIFATLDFTLGYKTQEEIANEIIRKAATAVISKGISVGTSNVFSGIGEKLSSNGLNRGSQFLGAVQNATTSYANSAAASYINSFDFVRWSMDWEQANSFWTNTSNYTNALGTITTGVLGEINNIDGNGVKLNGLFGKHIESMNGTIGSLTGAALNYLYTGDISFNVASINRVGLLELGIHDGKFGASISEGGVNLSLGAIMDFVKGAKEASKAAEFRKGDLETQTTLNTANLLAWSGTKNNVELAQKLYNSEKKIVFEEFDDPNEFSKTNDGNIVINSNFLSDNKDQQAMIASLAAYENALTSANELEIDPSKFEGMKKEDGSDFTKEEIENMINKMKSDNTINTVTDTAAAFVAAHDLLNSDYDSIENTENFAGAAEYYKQFGGKEGIFALYAAIYEIEKKKLNGTAEASSEEQKEGEDTTPIEPITFANVMKLGWYQNDGSNSNYVMGSTLTIDEYNQLARENAAERYALSEISKIGDINKMNPDDVKAMKEFFMEEAFKKENALKEFGYEPINSSQTKYKSGKVYNLGNHGCTLSTAVYIAYSITGKVMSLKEANDILVNNDVFTGEDTVNGISIKSGLHLGYGSYAKAINTLAKAMDSSITEDVIKLDVSYEPKDVKSKDGKSFEETKADGTKKIFNKIIDIKKDTDEVYFTHLRVNNGGHSVLLKSMTCTNKNAPGEATVGVYNPWNSTGNLGRTSYALSEVARADFYKLTAAGKEYYKTTTAGQAYFNSLRETQ